MESTSYQNIIFTVQCIKYAVKKENGSNHPKFWIEW